MNIEQYLIGLTSAIHENFGKTPKKCIAVVQATTNKTISRKQKGSRVRNCSSRLRCQGQVKVLSMAEISVQEKLLGKFEEIYLHVRI